MCVGKTLLLAALISVVAVHSAPAEDEFPSYYTPEQKVRMKKFRAEVDASMAKMTDADREKVNDGLKMMHDICAAKEKKLLYEIDHETIAREARLFGATQGWGHSGQDKTMRFDGKDAALPASIRGLTPNWVSIFDDQVHLEFGGGMQHQGLTVFREPKGGTGTVQVGKGVWYTSENNRTFLGQPPPKVPR